MNLRKLEKRDILLMLEWMHDPSVVKDLQTDFKAKTATDCENFIDNVSNTDNGLHLAIVDDNDVYMGTVSLKHIEDRTAEFAIIVRAIAMGKGYSKYGMTKMIEMGFEKLGLEQIYWCVNPQNYKALRFYDKNGYMRVEHSGLKIRGGTVQNRYNNIFGIKSERSNSWLCTYESGGIA